MIIDFGRFFFICGLYYSFVRSFNLLLIISYCIQIHTYVKKNKKISFSCLFCLIEIETKFMLLHYATVYLFIFVFSKVFFSFSSFFLLLPKIESATMGIIDLEFDFSSPLSKLYNIMFISVVDGFCDCAGRERAEPTKEASMIVEIASFFLCFFFFVFFSKPNSKR